MSNRAVLYDSHQSSRLNVGFCPIATGTPSPAGRGGHMWILFDALVDARAARRHARQVAPMLSDVGEYWPGPEQAVKWNKVRLPGGKYVSPEMSVWCKLYDPDGRELSHDGLSSARALLNVQTPASIVPPLPADYQEPERPPDAGDFDHRQDQRERSALQLQREQRSASSEQHAPDAQQERKYGQVNRFLWFHYTPAQLAAWYNERNSVDDILDFDRSELEDAARRGVNPPGWVVEIMSEAGWRHYWQVRKSQDRQHHP